MTKKIIFAIVLMLHSAGAVSAKKVKFAVDLTGSTPSVNGIHVMGDFQAAAAFPGGDWLPGTTQLTLEPGTEIYSIVVDIPAFVKYEYIFVNGDQSYEIEFIPLESRALHNFSDYRWLYVDSITNDTTFAGAILFGGNAPAGLSLVRFKVNMTQQTISLAGVHVAGSFQGWNPAATRMFSFEDTVYQHITYVSNGAYEYRFVNGNAAAGYEAVYGSCAINYGRSVIVTGDIVLDPVNFSSCLVGISENSFAGGIRLYPNPAAASSFVVETTGTSGLRTITISDLTGRTIKTESGFQEKISIKSDEMKPGIYLVSIRDKEAAIANSRIIIE